MGTTDSKKPIDMLEWPDKMKVSEYQDRVSKMLASYGFSEKTTQPYSKHESHFMVNMIPKAASRVNPD
jgi:hypothetical protein